MMDRNLFNRNRPLTVSATARTVEDRAVLEQFVSLVKSQGLSVQRGLINLIDQSQKNQ